MVVVVVVVTVTVLGWHLLYVPGTRRRTAAQGVTVEGFEVR